MRWSASPWRRPAADARVAVTGAGSSGVFRHKAMEAALAKAWSAQSLAGVATSASDMMSDMHADAAYRAHLVGVLARARGGEGRVDLRRVGSSVSDDPPHS